MTMIIQTERFDTQKEAKDFVMNILLSDDDFYRGVLTTTIEDSDGFTVEVKKDSSDV